MKENEKEKFYCKQWFMWVCLIFFAPVGIFLIWKYHNYNKILKIALSILFGVIFLVAIIPTSDKLEPVFTEAEEAVETPSSNQDDVQEPDATPTIMPEEVQYDMNFEPNIKHSV